MLIYPFIFKNKWVKHLYVQNVTLSLPQIELNYLYLNYFPINVLVLLSRLFFNETILNPYLLINQKLYLMNIYISNLSYGVDDADLNTLFAEYGEVTSAKVIMDRETGRSRGFGFVEIADEAMGQKAIDELNGAEYDGKVITVNVAKPREERSNGSGRGGYNRGGGSRGGYNSNRRY